MRNLRLDKKIVLERIDIIQKSLERLKEFQSLSKGKFLLDKNFAAAEHYIRYGLEATFDICAHILSRIPGAYVGEYKKMAEEMGRQEIIPQKFAQSKLYQMAGYRNRLTHFYFGVGPKEMYGIIQNDLDDFKEFVKYIKPLLLDKK